ncbi:MAG TPA: DUF2892 domain-containing protein [Kofleriaceae bacterium]|nr:DUF2892 domain-containing protein [Kofleriaceae bacterium]
MKKNLGRTDRTVRTVAGLALLMCAVMAPLPLAVRGPAFGGIGVYLLLTALAGTCLGYTLMGRSTCPTGSRS